MVNTRSQKRRGMLKRATRKNLKNRNAQKKKRRQLKGGQEQGGQEPPPLPPKNPVPIIFETVGVSPKNTQEDYFTRFDNLKIKCVLNLEFKASDKDENKPKNRYGNIYANDDTIVKLSGENNYINANYITLDRPEQSGGSFLKKINPFRKNKGIYKLNQQEPLTITVDGNEYTVPLAGDPIMIDP